MKIVVDAQLPPQLARILFDEFGLDAVHVNDLPIADDRDIAAYALAEDAVVFTKDMDFVHLSNRSALAIVHLRLGNCDNTALFARVRTELTRIRILIANGQRIVDVR